jgi:hypothetical protein
LNEWNKVTRWKPAVFLTDFVHVEFYQILFRICYSQLSLNFLIFSSVFKLLYFNQLGEKLFIECAKYFFFLEKLPKTLTVPAQMIFAWWTRRFWSRPKVGRFSNQTEIQIIRLRETLKSFYLFFEISFTASVLTKVAW